MNVFAKFFRWFIPNKTAKMMAQMKKIVNKINDLADEYSSLSDCALKNKTVIFKDRLSCGETLEDVLVEAFATVREVSKRVLHLYHFDEQILAGIALFQGMMTEMKTGEGKTLASTTAVYLHALSGEPVHIATVNDYLAKRDAQEMGRIFEFLGLTCGYNIEGMNIYQKKKVYEMDIVYATGSTFGFDYLRDNMALDPNEVCQRGLSFVLVDEADKLIDDGRTPLIISSSLDSNVDYYYYVADLIRKLDECDYEIEKKRKTVFLTEKGINKIDQFLFLDGKIKEGESLFESDNLEYIHALNQCLRAFFIFKKDVDYIVHNNEILLIDEMTGRILDGRRLSDGLHQSIEAKEKVKIHNEDGIGASISYQRFFALYKKFSGMSGTCLTEAEEFYDLYKVDTVVIPTHKKVIRVDEIDAFYFSFEEKFNDIIKDIKEAHVKKQPILIITSSVASSEIFAKGLKKHNFKFNVLNAKFHKEEAEIISQAGMPGAITLATNMAGRGTDIQLGGNYDMQVRKLRNQGISEAEINLKKDSIKVQMAKNREIVVNAGGLFVIGTERNESRRVDDQARGRSGRQGDPGRSKFYVSCDDELFKIFGSAWLFRMISTPGEIMTDPMLSGEIERIQKTIESNYFESRKHNLKYDLVLDKQRRMIYEFRHKYLFDSDILSRIKVFINHNLENLSKLKDNAEYVKYFKTIFAVQFDDVKDAEYIVLAKLETLIPQIKYFKIILLHKLDNLWQRHLTQVSYLKDIVSLRANAQKDPLTEYQIEAYNLFAILLDEFRDRSLQIFFTANLNFINEEENFSKKENSNKEENEIKFDELSVVYSGGFGKTYK